MIGMVTASVYCHHAKLFLYGGAVLAILDRKSIIINNNIVMAAMHSHDIYTI